MTEFKLTTPAPATYAHTVGNVTLRVDVTEGGDFLWTVNGHPVDVLDLVDHDKLFDRLVAATKRK